MELEKRIVSPALVLRQRAHQHDASARAVGFVAGHQERGAALEAKAAVNAGVQAGEAAGGHPSPVGTASTP